MFSRYQYTVATDAERNAERRRQEELRELMARPDAAPEPVTVTVRRKPRRPSMAGIGRWFAGWLTVGRRRPTRSAPNRNL
jgi:hypothetical protein